MYKACNLSQTKTILFGNVRSLLLRLNLNIDDVRSDYNTPKLKANVEIDIFVDFKLCLSDRDDVHQPRRELTGYRNDSRL